MSGPQSLETIRDFYFDAEEPLREIDILSKLLEDMLLGMKRDDPLPEAGYWLAYEVSNRATALRQHYLTADAPRTRDER